jgi:hypothetical protein
MSFLTIFTAPKPFTNPHIATIQRNAILSWLHLGGEVEVILVGEEAGLGEGLSAELGVQMMREIAPIADRTQLSFAYEVGKEHRRRNLRLLTDVTRNEQGTPLVSSIFSLARAASESHVLAYLNADILVMPEILGVIRQVMAQEERFLVIGQRWDLDVTQDLDFDAAWEARLRSDVQRRGRLHPPAGSDYFIFPRSLFYEMPEFAIGRAGWDNWMIYHALQQGWPVIDATPSLMVIHQSHDYSHLPGGQPHYDLEESQHNMALAGGPNHMFMVLDADKQLRAGQIRAPRPSLPRLLRRIELWITPPARQGPRWTVARRLRRWRRAITGDAVKEHPRT